MSYSEEHLREAAEIVSKLDAALCEKAVELLATVRARGGRLFILGVGGSAANASHAVNDFRKIAGIECYAPTDNVSELTARTNDEGWTSVFSEWLKGSHLSEKDALLILSVGGGSVEKNVSPNLVAAVQLAKERGAALLGILGRDGVLNRPVVRNGQPHPPSRVEDFELYDDVADGCARLKAAEFLLVVITNQPDVGRGMQSREAVEAMHAKMQSALPSLDRIEICYHAGERYGES